MACRALKKGRLDLVGEFVVSWQAEPSLSQFRQGKYAMAKHKISTFERLRRGSLNHKQRKELGRRLNAVDPGLTIVHPNAGGVDAGNESHFVAVPPDRDSEPVREFGCWTDSLVSMAKCLRSCRVDTVAIQATGVYWIALYDILTQHGIQVTLVSAQHTKNVPGRKTDVQESQWLM